MTTTLDTNELISPSLPTFPTMTRRDLNLNLSRYRNFVEFSLTSIETDCQHEQGLLSIRL